MTAPRCQATHRLGRRAEARAHNTDFGFDAASIDAVLLSHAPIDHAGLLPRLWAEGFRGCIYATHATYDLCGPMLRDSAYLQEKDVALVNKRHRRKGKPPVEPLYTIEEAGGVMEHFVGVSYRQPFSPASGVTVECRDAGHILGGGHHGTRLCLKPPRELRTVGCVPQRRCSASP